MQEASYLGKITQVSTWYQDGIDSENNSGIQRCCHGWGFVVSMWTCSNV